MQKEIQHINEKRTFALNIINEIKTFMNKAELIEALAQRSGLQKQKAKKLLEAYVDIVTEAMSHNEEIVLIGFGTLIPRPQTERLARNPKTGTPVMIPARTTVKFKPGKYLLDAINKPEEKK